MQEERRRFPRLSACVNVTYKKESASLVKKISISKNIGKGGICLIAYDELNKDDVINLEIFLPESDNKIIATAKVVWRNEFYIGDDGENKRYDAGVEFMDINDTDIERINKYIFAHLSKG